MSNEIKVNVRLTVENGDYKEDINPGQKQVDQTAQGAAGGIVAIGTSAETVSFADVSTEGYMFLQNLDGTNYVKYGPDSTGMVDFGRLKAGEVAVLRVEPGTTFKAQADTATVKLKYLMLED